MAQQDETGGGTAETPPYRRWTEERSAAGNGDGGTPSGTRRIAREFGERVENRVNWTFGAAADRLDDTAGRIDRLAERGGTADTGTRGLASGVARSVAEMMESAAAFLRNNDVDSLRSDMRRQMRESPLRTLMIGVAAGWVMGKILR